ncbi:ATP-dependent DNA helicase RecG [Pollutibacter soli]|uniref:ATP-dependent DNA helicase RecG n=1 Tax=Pollutibacter soli TaxID=3034157 RepID=UPI003013407D
MHEISDISFLPNILSNPIEYLKGVGPFRADLLKKELNIFSFHDLLNHFPYRYVDKTRINLVREITSESDYIQVKGKLMNLVLAGDGRSKRITGIIKDASGELTLTWFQGINWIQKNLTIGNEYLVFGKVGFYLGLPQLTHPEIERWQAEEKNTRNFLEPVYPVTEKLKARGITGRNLGNITANLFSMISENDLIENLPGSLMHRENLLTRFDAYRNIHFPSSVILRDRAVYRLKFEELLISQIRLGMLRSNRHRYSKGIIFGKVGDLFNRFYNDHLPFQLTNAQKRVLKEIRKDAGSGHQMNRLLQGDVGSGKTMVALMSMLLAIDNGYQCCLMAPTEILARQHYEGISGLLKDLPVSVAILTGSTKTASRKKLLAQVESGEVQILIGTHALIESAVQFKQLGLAIIDEQHRFGVEQRAKLREKGENAPHILVMTATPIPRTLAMTAFGDLDTSVIDELPPGRQPILTTHRLEDSRPQVMNFIRNQIEQGRQAYVIFPLIEESEKMYYENLMRGYENIKAWFPEPKFYISMVHGRMPADLKESNMQRFVSGDTQIMVSTTVIEVGVNVPNATVMVIESAEKFGLSQLHQLRGRVGRGSDKSYCILLTGNKVSAEARERLSVLCATNDGFKIAEKDLEIRGPGDIEGTRQSGALQFKLADIMTDKLILEKAKSIAEKIIAMDVKNPDNEFRQLLDHLQRGKNKTPWSRIA